MIRTKNTEVWQYVKENFPTIHLFRNVYLLRQYTYSKRKIAWWRIVIVEADKNEK